MHFYNLFNMRFVLFCFDVENDVCLFPHIILYNTQTFIYFLLFRIWFIVMWYSLDLLKIKIIMRGENLKKQNSSNVSLRVYCQNKEKKSFVIKK